MNIIRRMRRIEIIRFARHIGVADTDDLDRFLKVWIWHHPPAFKKEPIFAVIEAACRMGRPHLSETEAEQIIQASRCGKALHKADDLGEYLRLSDEMRTTLGIRTIGAHDVSKRQRAMRRRRRNREAKERRRHERGARPQAQSLSRTKPWEREGICRRTWERRRNRDAVSQLRPQSGTVSQLRPQSASSVSVDKLATAESQQSAKRRTTAGGLAEALMEQEQQGHEASEGGSPLVATNLRHAARQAIARRRRSRLLRPGRDAKSLVRSGITCKLQTL
jgi:hypothetical protein